MDKTHGEDLQSLMKTSGISVDESIATMASRPMSEVVTLAEGRDAKIGFPYGNRNAAKFLVGRLFTDAIFSQDIRAIQLIINRIDGGLPKDTELGDYQTMFGDCLADVMSSEIGDQIKVMPDDTVMMALCKSLYSMAVEDIYVRWDKNKECFVPNTPTDAKKKERDAALRMVLERTGGRKTMSAKAAEKDEIEIAGWVKKLKESSVQPGNSLV